MEPILSFHSYTLLNKDMICMTFSEAEHFQNRKNKVLRSECGCKWAEKIFLLVHDRQVIIDIIVSTPALHLQYNSQNQRNGAMLASKFSQSTQALIMWPHSPQSSSIHYLLVYLSCKDFTSLRQYFCLSTQPPPPPPPTTPASTCRVQQGSYRYSI